MEDLSEDRAGVSFDWPHPRQLVTFENGVSNRSTAIICAVLFTLLWIGITTEKEDSVAHLGGGDIPLLAIAFPIKGLIMQNSKRIQREMFQILQRGREISDLQMCHSGRKSWQGAWKKLRVNCGTANSWKKNCSGMPMTPHHGHLSRTINKSRRSVPRWSIRATRSSWPRLLSAF